MKISFNPSTVAALTLPPKNKDITFDLRGHNIFARGVEFKGTDTNTWRSVTINGTSLGTKTLELKNGSNISITANGTISAINLASSSHTHPLVINGKSFSLGTTSLNLGTYVPWTSNGYTLSVSTKSGNDIDTGGGLYIDAYTGTLFYLWLHDTSNVWYKKTASGSWKKMDAGNADTWGGYSAKLTSENTSGTKILVVDGTNVQYRTLSSILAGHNTWRNILINGTSIGTNILNLKNGSNIILSNTNGQVTISASGLASSDHNHDGRYAWQCETIPDTGRINYSGFFLKENKSGTVQSNIPFTSWVHLINCQHSNTANNYALQIAASFFDNSTFKIRVTNNKSITTTWNTIIHSGNYKNYVSDKDHTHSQYIKRTGDTMSGALNFANNTWNLIGDDSYVGDCNITGHFGIKAANTTYPGIAFYKSDNNLLGKLTAYSNDIRYGSYSLQFLDNGNTTVTSSTWRNPFNTYNANAVANNLAICIWGLSSKLDKLSSDTGDISLWLRRVNASVATLNMVLDGNVYANLVTNTNCYYVNGNAGIDMLNSDIVGVNGIWTNDLSDDPTEGILFARSNGNYDSIRAANGNMYFALNISRTTQKYDAEYTVLHTGNTDFTTYLGYTYSLSSPNGKWYGLRFPSWNTRREQVRIYGNGNNCASYCYFYCGSRYSTVWGHLTLYNTVTVDYAKWYESTNGQFVLAIHIPSSINGIEIKCSCGLSIELLSSVSDSYYIDATFFTLGYIRGYVYNALLLVSQSSKNLESGTTMVSSGLRLYQFYNNSNGPGCSYGNVLEIGGLGHGQLFAEWTGSSARGNLYYRSKRDNSGGNWSSWGRVLYSDEKIDRALYADRLYPNSEFAKGNHFLQYYNWYGMPLSGIGNAAPDTDWWHIIRMNHGNSGGYFSELAIALNSWNGVYWRTIINGSEVRTWTRLANANEFSNYVYRGGDSMWGRLTLQANLYNDSYDSGALHLNNSNIIGVNSIYTNDYSDDLSEGIHFWRDSSHVDTLRMAGGNLLFTPYRPLGGTNTEYTVIHSGNRNNWAQNSISLALYMSSSDSAWYPIVWGGYDHHNTNNSSGLLYKSFDVLSWQTSSLTLYATNLRAGDMYMGATNELYTTTYDLYINYHSRGGKNVIICDGNGHVGIGTGSPGYKLTVNGNIYATSWVRTYGNAGWYSETYGGGWYMIDTTWIRAFNNKDVYTAGRILSGNGFYHEQHINNNATLLAGGSYKLIGGAENDPRFIGYLTLTKGSGKGNGAFYYNGRAVSYTYDRYNTNSSVCVVNIPNLNNLIIYIRAAFAQVLYSGGGMYVWTGLHRGDGAWWVHCYAPNSNTVYVKCFRNASNENDGWWGGNPLGTSQGDPNSITVLLFGYVTIN